MIEFGLNQDKIEIEIWIKAHGRASNSDFLQERCEKEKDRVISIFLNSTSDFFLINSITYSLDIL